MPTAALVLASIALFLQPDSEAAAQAVEIKNRDDVLEVRHDAVGEPRVIEAPARDEAGALELEAQPASKGTGIDLSGVPRGELYTWDDGGRTRRVYLQEDLVVDAKGEVAAAAGPVAETAGGPIVRVGAASNADGLPVFRSVSGSLMTLPGGVLLVFVPEWGEAEIGAFFEANGIAMERLGPLGEIPNGFVVDTEPGFPSLELAKALAGLNGVRLSSPNWWEERTAR